MKKLSNKQKLRNAEVARIKASREKVCVICGSYGNDLAHILPKDLFPEFYAEPLNLVILCRKHHVMFDDDTNIEFRQKQVDLYNQVKELDLLGANRHFKI